MSLKLVNLSSNRKTGAIATTYRAGASMYSTCPASCSLNPDADNSSNKIDKEYLNALINAVPKRGKAWTYTHFDYKNIPSNQDNKTVINYSADTVVQALNSFHNGHQTTYTAPATMSDKVDIINGVKFVKCPAEDNKKITCQNCGSGEPLCARVKHIERRTIKLYDGDKGADLASSPVDRVPCLLDISPTFGVKYNFKALDDFLFK
jgi:hypothetical protein